MFDGCDAAYAAITVFEAKGLLSARTPPSCSVLRAIVDITLKRRMA
jgi:hypothetical protein